MRHFGTDKEHNNFVVADQDLIRDGHGELNIKERWLITYLRSHKFGYEIGPKQIAEDAGVSVSTVHRMLDSLKEKGYFFRNKETKSNGDEYIVAETPELLQRVVNGENLFTEEDQPRDEKDETEENSKPNTKEKSDEEFATDLTTLLSVPGKIVSSIFAPNAQWQKIPEPEEPVTFNLPPFQKTGRAEEEMDSLWRIWVAHNPKAAIGLPHTGDRQSPALFGKQVSHIRDTGSPTYGRPPHPRSPTYGRPHKRNTKGIEVLDRINILPHIPNRRLSNVWSHRARIRAKADSTETASNKHMMPDRNRSKDRLWVKMFEKKTGRPYQGIRLYSEEDFDREYRPTLENGLSIYWLPADPERAGGPLPEKYENESTPSEEPLDGSANPREEAEIPERFAELGIELGNDQPHPTNRQFRARIALRSLLWPEEMEIQPGPNPWPEPDPNVNRELSFAGHRPDEQLPDVHRVGDIAGSTEFLREAYRAVWIEPFTEEERPTEPSAVDHQRAKEHGKDPEDMMLLRQVAEVTISPHIFDEENRYGEPGPDPWPLRMFDLAFPEVNLTVESKHLVDEKVTRGYPASPSEWANVLLMGMERDWNPKFVENFVRCYRHEMGIERDPSRDVPPGGPRTSQGEIMRGNGIDLSEGDPKELIPPKEGYK